MPDPDPPLPVLEPRSSLDMTYNSHGEPLRRYLAAAPGRANSWLLSWIMPMYATFYTETQEEVEKLGRSFTAALTASRVLNAGRVVYGLMVKTYPAGRINSFDDLVAGSSGAIDTSTSTVGHYKKIHSACIGWFGSAALNVTGGSFKMETTSGKLFILPGSTDALGTNKLQTMIMNFDPPFETPVEAGSGEATITLTIPTFDAGSMQCKVALHMEDIIGNPLTE